MQVVVNSRFGLSGLQWGRDLSIAEIVVSGDPSLSGYPLQWGRDLSIAEIESHPNGLCFIVGFNGAAISRSRQWMNLPDEFEPDGPASMGPRSLDRGNRPPDFVLNRAE